MWQSNFKWWPNFGRAAYAGERPAPRMDAPPPARVAYELIGHCQYQREVTRLASVKLRLPGGGWRRR